MDSAKQSKRVRYWIRYRLPDGKQKTELVKGEDVSPYSIEDARAVHSKRVIQKKEKKWFDMVPDTETAFSELSKQYLNQEDIKSAPSYRVMKIRVDKLKDEIGNMVVADILPMHLNNYRAKLEKQELSDSYIDDILVAGKMVINWAYENKLASGDTHRNFKQVKKTLSGGENRRNKTYTYTQYEAIKGKCANQHTKDAWVIGYWTGLRQNNVLALKWSQIDLAERFISFEIRNRRRKKPIPCEVYIVDELYSYLRNHPDRLRAAGTVDYLIRYKGKPVKDISRSLTKAHEDARLIYSKVHKDGLIYHDLRHTSVTDMRRAGIDLMVNKVWHGHSTTKDAHSHYHTVSREDLQKAGQLLQDYRDKLRKEVKLQASNQEEDVNQL
jgi:integrase